MTKIRLPALLLVLGCLSGARTPAADLVVGVEDLAYLPYYAVENGEYVGFARDLLDAFAHDSGHHLRYRPLPVERLYRQLLDGDVDLKFPDHPQWRPDLKAGKNVRYSTELAPYVDGVMVRRDSLDRPLADKALTVGTIRGFTPWALLDQVAAKRLVLSENNRITGLLRQVASGRLDGAYLNRAVAHYRMERIPGLPGALELDPRLPLSRSGYAASTIAYPEVLQALDAWVEKNAGHLARLREKWELSP